MLATSARLHYPARFSDPLQPLAHRLADSDHFARLGEHRPGIEDGAIGGIPSWGGQISELDGRRSRGRAPRVCRLPAGRRLSCPLDRRRCRKVGGSRPHGAKRRALARLSRNRARPGAALLPHAAHRPRALRHRPSRRAHPLAIHVPVSVARAAVREDRRRCRAGDSPGTGRRCMRRARRGDRTTARGIFRGMLARGGNRRARDPASLLFVRVLGAHARPPPSPPAQSSLSRTRRALVP